MLGKEDVNDYNDNGLEEYTPPTVEGEKLLDIKKNEWTNKEELKLSPYYKNVTIKDIDNKFYSIYIDYEGNPVLSGKDIVYTFTLVGEDIKARQYGKTYNVESNENSLKIENKEFDLEFDYNLFS